MFKKIYLIILSCLLILSTGQLSADNAISLFFSGYPEANSYSGEISGTFSEWCGGACVPTTQFPLIDPDKGKTVGMAYVWGKDFLANGDGSNLCFTEYIMYDLKDRGQIYTSGNPAGTCGIFFDPSFKQAVTDPDALLLTGGGDGLIVDATHAFKKYIGGTYTDRVWVEFLYGNIHYYSSLFFLLNKPENEKKSTREDHKHH